MAISEFTQRLRLAIDGADATHEDIAGVCEVSRPAVTHWVNGRNDPPREAIERIALRCNVRAGWLSHGEGPMREGDLTVPDDERPTLTPTDGARAP